jgi:lipoprotein-anchoring transpeptidase ErfK/SrfK
MSPRFLTLAMALLAAGVLATALAVPAAARAAGDPTPTPTTDPTTAPTPDPAAPAEPKQPKQPKTPVATTPVSVSLAPGSGPLGVGQLVTMTFSQPVGRKAQVEQAISITSDKALPPGSWGWIDSTTAIYRPRTFWPGHARIAFHLNLRHLVLRSDQVSKSKQVDYVGNSKASRTYALRTGRSMVIAIKDSTHRMYVRTDGRLVKTFPVSLGKRSYETRSGIKILTDERYASLRMTGTDRLTGEHWDVQAPYSTRLTPTGEFIHGAPWAYYRMGKYNGSHGCTNMYVGDARWIYHHVRRGDPVVTTGTGRRMELTNGTPGSYWNYRYSQWRQKSALH